MKNKLPAFTFRTLINKYGHYIKNKLGMDETAIQQDYENYKGMQPDSSERDYMWSLFQRMIIKGEGSDTYREMGSFIAQFKGMDGKQYQRLALVADFEHIKYQ